jgi:signal transduction histidine kinase/ActR/RegA family two-component response regulator
VETAEEILFVVRDRRGGEASERCVRWSRALLSVLGVSTLVLDAGGRIREIGPGWIADRGSLADWLGRHVGDLFDSDRREIVSGLRQAARTGDWTGRLLSGGGPVPLHLRAVRGDDDGLEAFVGVRLPDEAGLFGEIFRRAPVGMIRLDANLRIVEVNARVRAILGDGALPPDPAGLDVRSLAVFQTREAQTALEGLPDRGGFDLPDLAVRTPGQDPLRVELRGERLSSPYGRGSGYVLMMLTEAPSGTHPDRQMMWTQKMESIGTFASGLAHDFGNFVSVILGKAGVLRVKLPDDPHIVCDLNDIETAAKRGQHLAQELMRFARGGRNRVETLQVNRLIEEVNSLVRTSIGRRIEVEYRLDPDLRPVQGDEVELQQLLLNLCLNARDAMPDGGRLTLETRPPTPEQLDRLDRGADVSDGVCIIVRDTGIGMSPEVAERIFEPFFSTKEEQTGMGLGLAMVYAIVRRHGGAIDVQSTPGRGTTFEIVLPAAAAEPAAPQGPEILVVDDEPAFREMVRLILEEDGHRVRLAANGVEAVQTLREGYAGLGLVILDLRMPGMDGLAVLEELKELAPDLPVLVATGYATPEEKAQAMEAGARKILEKPYQVADLRSALIELLGPARRTETHGEPAA